MIVDNGKYYLYRHIRLDKNEPFYVGIGTKTKQDVIYSTYTRAFTNTDRNNTWKGIATRVDYRVEILLESDEMSFIKCKEKEFIKIYGKIINNNGTLANYSDGGEGTSGVKKSQKERAAMSIRMTGRKINPETIEKAKATKKKNNYKVSEETKQKISLSNKKSWYKRAYRKPKNEVFVYNKNGTFKESFKTVTDASLALKIKENTIKKYCRGFRNHLYQKYFLFYTNRGDKIKYEVSVKTQGVAQPILKIDLNTGNILKEYSSIKKAGEEIRPNVSTATGCIREVCVGGRQKSAYGFGWKFKEIIN